MKKGQNKKPLFIVQIIGKKTYYRNEKGRLISKKEAESKQPDRVLTGKGKEAEQLDLSQNFIIQRVGKKTYIRNKKGQIISKSNELAKFIKPEVVIKGKGSKKEFLKDSRKNKGSKKVEQPKEQFISGDSFGQSLRNEFNLTIQENKKLLLKKGKEVIQISPKSLIKAQSFYYDAESLYIRIFMKEFKLTNSPQLKVPHKLGKKSNIFDFGDMELLEEEEAEEMNEDYNRAAKKYNKELNKIWKKYFD